MELKGQIIALVGSFAVAFIGSWIQLNQRISRVETQIEYIEQAIQKVSEVDGKVNVILEQNQWIIRDLQEQKESLKEIRKEQTK